MAVLGHNSELVQSIMEMLNLDHRKVFGFTLRAYADEAVTMEVLEYVLESNLLPDEIAKKVKRFKLIFEEII